MKKIFLIHSIAIAILSPWGYAQPLPPSSPVGAIGSTPGSISQKNIGQTPLSSKQNNAVGTYIPAATQKNELLEAISPLPYSTTSPASTSKLQQNLNATSTKAVNPNKTKDGVTGSLIDANLEEKSTQLKAALKQEVIAIQSLPLTND